MNKILVIFTLFFCLSNFAIAQKVDFDKKTGLVSLEDETLFKIERQGSKDFYFDILNLEGERLFVVKYKYGAEYTDGWFEFIFLDAKEKVEVADEWSASRKILARYIHNNGLIKDGALNQEAIEEFILLKEIEPQKTIKLIIED